MTYGSPVKTNQIEDGTLNDLLVLLSKKTLHDKLFLSKTSRSFMASVIGFQEITVASGVSRFVAAPLNQSVDMSLPDIMLGDTIDSDNLLKTGVLIPFESSVVIECNIELGLLSVNSSRIMVQLTDNSNDNAVLAARVFQGVNFTNIKWGGNIEKGTQVGIRITSQERGVKYQVTHWDIEIRSY